MTSAWVIAVGRPTFDLDFGAAHVEDAWSVLGALDIEVAGDRNIVVDDIDEAIDSIGLSDVVVVLQATFTDSSLAGRIVERTSRPVLVWSFPEERTGGRLRLNSLCGANLAAYLLRRRGDRAQFVHVDPTEATAGQVVGDALTRLVAPASATATSGRGTAVMTRRGRHDDQVLAGLRIGVVGDPPIGFEPCVGDAAELLRSTGIAVDRIPLDDLFTAADGVDEAARAAISWRIHSTMTVEDDVARAGIEESIGLFGGLSELAARHGWSALATRCWPECMTEYGAAACTPMAMLTEDGVPSVCEADMYGAATALVLSQVGGSDPFVADLVDADPRDDTSVVWHCGVAPISIADPRSVPVGITHPNRHRALANQFALRPGRVTLARLSQASGQISMVIGSGRVLDRPRPFIGTCGVLRWDRSINEVLRTVFDRGLEHHIGLVYGDHRERLEELAAAWDLPVVILGDD